MSENKKVEEKKTPNVWVTILCIALIIAMFFVGWFAGGKTAELEDKIIDKATEKEEKKKEEKVEKDVELASLRDDLTEKVVILEALGDNIYVRDIENAQISNDSKLYNILGKLYRDYYNESPVTTNYNFGNLESNKNYIVQLDVSLVEDEYRKIYGNTEISHKGTDTNSCPMFIYDSSNNKYYAYSACGGTTTEGILTYINRVTTMDDEAYVYVSLGAYSLSNVYTEFEKTNLYKEELVDRDNMINESNYKDFSEYKYTFVNEDGNYIFKSLKRIK